MLHYPRSPGATSDSRIRSGFFKSIRTGHRTAVDPQVQQS
jgi:hypothetical protein